MTYRVQWTSQFKKDYKAAMKRKLDISELDRVIKLLAKGEELPAKYRDHALTGDWIGFRECHIRPDWLLIYYYLDEQLVLTLSRTGSHSELFG